MRNANVVRGLSCLIASMVLAISPSDAMPLNFDCDAMPEHSSSVDQVASGDRVEVTGRISIVEKRSGRFLPLAGILFSPANDNGPPEEFIGIQIAASRDGKQTSDITTRDYAKGLNEIKNIATVPDRDVKSFSLSFSRGRGLSGIVDGHSFSVPAARTAEWAHVRVRAICSTGQFKFFDLSITPAAAEAGK